MTDSTTAPLAGFRLLHVHAHPDDESSKGAATTAKYVRAGAEVMVATCTGGERGSILNPAMDRPEIAADITGVRAKEMAAARQILGISQEWLGFVDSGLPEGDPLPPLPSGSFATQKVDQAALPLVQVIRDFQPQVMTTYDENGGYPHPDHIMCHKISMYAFEKAADPDFRPDLGPAWQVSKLYYQMQFNGDQLAALDEAMKERGLESPYTERLKAGGRDRGAGRATTHVDAGEFFPVRDAALLAHATQVDPEGPWFAVPLDLQQAAWPTEDYELVRSRVATVTPEAELYDGLDFPKDN